ncbi:MAG TPA: hypothetical protein VGG94_05665 [Chthoniobacterales bacterium]
MFLATILAIALFGFAHNASAQSGLSQPLVSLANSISMSSTSFIDSFDSSDPAKSTNGLYDPAKFQHHGNVGVLNNTGSDLRNAVVFGDLFYSGALAPRNTTRVEGIIATPYTSTIPWASNPTWIPDATYTGSAAATVKTFVAGSSTSPTRIKISGDYNVSGGTPVNIVPSAGGGGYIEFWVTGKFNASGGSRILQDPAVHAAWIVDKDITTCGDCYRNGSGSSANLSFIAVGTGKVNISGFGNLAGTITAPERDVAVGGGGALSGGLFGKTLTINGNSSVHCDEELLVP